MKYKIIFIHYGGGIGGAPVSLVQLVSSLDKELFDPIIIFTESGPIIEFASKLGLRIKVVHLKSVFFYSEHVKIRLRMLARWIFY